MKRNTKILIQTIDLLIKKAFPFAVYQHPATNEICIIVQHNPTHLVHSTKTIYYNDGFLISPFESAKTGLSYFVKNDLFACENDGFDDFIEKLTDIPSNNNLISNSDNYEMTKEEYLDKAELLIRKLRNKELDKVVFSRIKIIERSQDFSIAKFYLRLAKKYPKAFVFLFYIPDTGMWIGATPETLISQKNNGDATIMSLAGTAPYQKEKKIIWSEKEIVEQQFVSEFIRLKLAEYSIKDYIEYPTETVIAGHLAHIQTIFKIPKKQIKEHIGSLLKGLHPTPAVCGLPQADAFKLIERTEPHSRKFYSGFLGPCMLNGKTDMYVNLRCAEIDSNNIYLYVGGGLTADSDPYKEWEETELKAKILLSQIEPT